MIKNKFNQVVGKLLKSEFNRNVLTLMTGTTIAQAIPIAITPILTRIYTPEDFGVFALFIGIASIFGTIVNGRYELAIMLPRKGEDAINIVNSNSIIKDLVIANVPSDGLDVDFGTLEFSEIICNNIGNDCLDTSGAKINGNIVNGKKIGDKLISIGEKSILNLNKVLGSDLNIGVAVKDSSFAEIDNLSFTSTNIDIAVFQKKPFFGPAKLIVHNAVDYSSSQQKNLVADNNILNINKELQPTFGSSIKIEKLLYAKQ